MLDSLFNKVQGWRTQTQTPKQVFSCKYSSSPIAVECVFLSVWTILIKMVTKEKT